MTLELEWTRASAGLYFSGPYKITKTSKGWVTQFNNLDVSHLSTLKLAKYCASVDASNRISDDR